MSKVQRLAQRKAKPVTYSLTNDTASTFALFVPVGSTRFIMSDNQVFTVKKR